MPLPLTVSCFSKIQIGLPFWYRLTRVVPDKVALNGGVCVLACILYICVCVGPLCLWFCCSLDVIKYSLSFSYLSPIVLRKELEMLMEQHGEGCLDSSKLVDSHAIVFWNLVSLSAFYLLYMR